MLAHPTLDQLHALGLYGLAKGFKELENKAEVRGLDHAEWLGLLLEYELTLRRQKQFETRARVAKLRHPASVEDVNYQSPRGLDRALFLKLAACDWIAERRNLLVTGASGLGKSWLACALGHKACRENMSVLYTRMPRLFADLAIANGDARYARLLRSLARVKLIFDSCSNQVIDIERKSPMRCRRGTTLRRFGVDQVFAPDARVAPIFRSSRTGARASRSTSPRSFCGNTWRGNRHQLDLGAYSIR